MGTNVAPSDDSDRSKLIGEDPPEDFHFVMDGRYCIWDNNMYWEIFIHHGLGEWGEMAAHPEWSDLWAALPQELKTEYIRVTGGPFPAAGGRFKELVGGQD